MPDFFKRHINPALVLIVRGKSLKCQIKQSFDFKMEASPEAGFFINIRHLSHGVAFFSINKNQGLTRSSATPIISGFKVKKLYLLPPLVKSRRHQHRPRTSTFLTPSWLNRRDSRLIGLQTSIARYYLYFQRCFRIVFSNISNSSIPHRMSRSS